MAWDPTRPVPWTRLVREWLLYVSIMAVIFVLLFRDRSLVGVFAGLLISGPLYLALGYVLAKFGYQRKTLREARAEAQADRVARTQSTPARPRPAPTRRTGGGGASRRSGKRRR